MHVTLPDKYLILPWVGKSVDAIIARKRFTTLLVCSQDNLLVGYVGVIPENLHVPNFKLLDGKTYRSKCFVPNSDPLEATFPILPRRRLSLPAGYRQRF